MSNMTINNNSYVGRSITVTGNKIIIDGVDVTPDSKNITISIEGNVDNLNVDVCQSVRVKGDVNSIATTSGDIEIDGNVTGSIKSTSGDIECFGVGGNINTTSGDVKCGNVKGSVSTISGNIRNKN